MWQAFYPTLTGRGRIILLPSSLTHLSILPIYTQHWQETFVRASFLLILSTEWEQVSWPNHPPNKVKLSILSSCRVTAESPYRTFGKTCNRETQRSPGERRVRSSLPSCILSSTTVLNQFQYRRNSFDHTLPLVSQLEFPFILSMFSIVTGCTNTHSAYLFTVAASPLLLPVEVLGSASVGSPEDRVRVLSR